MTTRIIAGSWKGRQLSAPAGFDTRPTNARARQAAFDILLHAPWAGAEFLRTSPVLDVFAGTGAYGLESLSRGAPAATFIENAAPALTCLRANIAACKAEALCKIVASDIRALRPGPAHKIVFLDPPYAKNLVSQALTILRAQGWLAPDALIIAELGPGDEAALAEILTERVHGKARLVFGRYNS
jgi:16S rRNA (guanine966-N2)-methyltransferase